MMIWAESDMNSSLTWIQLLWIERTLFADSGQRTVTMDEKFFTGYRRTIVAPDEVLVSILIPYTKKVSIFFWSTVTSDIPFKYFLLTLAYSFRGLLWEEVKNRYTQTYTMQVMHHVQVNLRGTLWFRDEDSAFTFCIKITSSYHHMYM